MRILHFHVAALGVELGHAEAGDHPLGLVARVQAHAAVALLLGVVEKAVVAMWRQERLGHVGFLGLQFLHADHVRVLLAHPLEKALLGRGADAVEVGADNP
ncbi:hypothetical protein D3C72_1438300 [compost metagenome]